ncbi:MAG: DegV family protein [Myxococcaceae bacterium]
MRIVTNPGSNLDEATTLRLGVDVVPQKIVVDGIPHDTRGTIDFAQVDSWVKRASKPAFVQGTTEPEFVDYFTRLLQKERDAEILVVMTSRDLIGSHDAAVSAVAKLRQSTDPFLQSARIEIVDSRVTDVGAGLITLVAVEARKAGLSLADAATLCRKFAERGKNVFSVATLDNLVKGGRASAVQGFVANFLNIRPLLSIEKGAIASVGRISSKADMGQKLAEALADRVDPQPVWVAIAHGNCADKAEALSARLKERYQVEFALVRPLSASIYLHVGPGGLVAFVYPLNGLPLRLPVPRLGG